MYVHSIGGVMNGAIPALMQGMVQSYIYLNVLFNCVASGTDEWMYVHSIGGVILTRENQSTWRKNSLNDTASTTNLAWEWTQASKVKGQQLTTCPVTVMVQCSLVDRLSCFIRTCCSSSPIPTTSIQKREAAVSSKMLMCILQTTLWHTP